MEISLSQLFADSKICDCYVLHSGYCYPVTDISEVKFLKYPSITVAQSEIEDLTVEIIFDDQVSYLLHIKPRLENLPVQIIQRPRKMNYPASRGAYAFGV